MSIKVIKQQQREARARLLSTESGKATERDASRDAAATIKSWIDELRQQRQREATLFKKLFEDGLLPPASGAADAAP